MFAEIYAVVFVCTVAGGAFALWNRWRGWKR